MADTLDELLSPGLKGRQVDGNGAIPEARDEGDVSDDDCLLSDEDDLPLFDIEDSNQGGAPEFSNPLLADPAEGGVGVGSPSSEPSAPQQEGTSPAASQQDSEGRAMLGGMAVLDEDGEVNDQSVFAQGMARARRRQQEKAVDDAEAFFSSPVASPSGSTSAKPTASEMEEAEEEEPYGGIYVDSRGEEMSEYEDDAPYDDSDDSDFARAAEAEAEREIAALRIQAASTAPPLCIVAVSWEGLVARAQAACRVHTQ